MRCHDPMEVIPQSFHVDNQEWIKIHFTGPFVDSHWHPTRCTGRLMTARGWTEWINAVKPKDATFLGVHGAVLCDPHKAWTDWCPCVTTPMVVGIHPRHSWMNEGQAGPRSRPFEQLKIKVKKAIQEHGQEAVLAIGETGLDRPRSLADLESQVRLMRAHLLLAEELRRTTVLHCRTNVGAEEKENDLLAVLLFELEESMKRSHDHPRVFYLHCCELSSMKLAIFRSKMKMYGAKMFLGINGKVISAGRMDDLVRTARIEELVA